MKKHTRLTICTCLAAALLAAPLLAPDGPRFAGATAQAKSARHPAAAQAAKPPNLPPAAAGLPKLPPRIAYTAADAAAAVIPGMPDARFWARFRS